MSDDCTKKRRKYWLLALFALFIGLIGLTLPEDSINYTNITLAGGNWTIDSNFTNLYPVERNLGITYWNNKTSPIILDFSFANMTDAVILNYTLWINDTVSERTVTLFGFGGSFQHFIPQGARYNITNITSGSTPIIYWYEHNIIMSPSIVNNYYNTTGSGGVFFNGTPVNLNGSNLYNGTIANYSTLDYTNSSLNLKVNKSGDNMTGTLNVQGVRVGDFRNYTQQGFDFNSTYFQGMFSAYNDSLCMYTGNSVNAYYDGIASFPNIGWHKPFKNQDSIIIQTTSCDPALYAVPAMIEAFAISVTTDDPFWNFDYLYHIDNKSTKFWKNSTFYDNITVIKNVTVDLLKGSGNAFARIDSTGKLYRDEIEGYTGGDQYFCINSSAGVYAKTSTCT